MLCLFARRGHRNLDRSCLVLVRSERERIATEDRLTAALHALRLAESLLLEIRLKSSRDLAVDLGVALDPLLVVRAGDVGAHLAHVLEDIRRNVARHKVDQHLRDEGELGIVRCDDAHAAEPFMNRRDQKRAHVALHPHDLALRRRHLDAMLVVFVE
eukprot:Amastigsp_a183512_5.p2 type:complete len:157 gc:universal Amastigsp_a183512_5:109-579(+)